MRAGFKPFVGAVVGSAVMAVAAGAFAQSAPSSSDIAGALRPIPQALRGGHQGLPTRAGAEPAAPVTTFGGPAPAARTEYSAPRSTASVQPRRTAYVTASAGHVGSPAGCPATLTSAGDKPAAAFPNITFEFGSAQLRPESLDTLRNLGKALNENLADQKAFTIEGHTDAVGTLAYNEELSRLRAEAVKNFLVNSVGVSASRLEVIGKGFCDPANPRNPRAAENRRVVVINQSS